MDPEATVEASAGEGAALPSLPTRLLWVFVSPGKLNERLAETPRWLGALLVSTLVIGLAVALIPADIFMEAQRRAMLERGGDFPEMGDRALNAMRIFIPTFAMLSTAIMTFLITGLYTVVFAFVLGDEGRYKQYLAVLTHSWFIAALFSLLVTPLRISTEDPQFTVNLASFLSFLPDGYLLNVFRALDLSQIWSTLVFAQGAHAIDNRRSFGSAATIALTALVLFAMAVASFM